MREAKGKYLALAAVVSLMLPGFASGNPAATINARAIATGSATVNVTANMSFERDITVGKESDVTFAQMYVDPDFIRFAANAIRWVTKETNERDYEFDLFLSYSSRDRDQARAVVRAAGAMGLTIFEDEKDVEPGAVWAEEIRRALVNSREMALLASPTSLVSEWVQTEWGAAWAMQRTITPILLMVAPNQLPDRLRLRQAVIYGEHEPYLQMVRDRARG